MTPPFERSEYDDRLRRTRAAMREAGLDVLLVFHQEHMFYLAGYDQIGYWVYQVLIVPADTSPMTAIVRKVDELLVRAGGIVEDVRVWLDDATLDPAQQTAEVLRERGLLVRKRVGIEIETKYRELAEPVLGPRRAAAVLELVEKLETLDSAAALAAALRPE